MADGYCASRRDTISRQTLKSSKYHDMLHTHLCLYFYLCQKFWNFTMKKLIFIATAAAFLLCACQKSIEDRAEQEARDYTRKFCPTPVDNYSRTDSLVFDRAARTFIYYCTLTDVMDDPELIEKNSAELTDGLQRSLRESTALKLYKDAGIGFKYVLHSEKNPELVLYEKDFPM